MRLIDADALLEKIDTEREIFVMDGRLGIEHILVHYVREFVEDAPTVDAVQGEKMSNQRVIEWVPIRERKPHLPGMYLVTVKAYINNKWDGKTVGTSATNWHNNKWLGRIQDDVLAWAEMPKPYRREE